MLPPSPPQNKRTTTTLDRALSEISQRTRTTMVIVSARLPDSRARQEKRKEPTKIRSPSRRDFNKSRRPRVVTTSTTSQRETERKIDWMSDWLDDWLDIHGAVQRRCRVAREIPIPSTFPVWRPPTPAWQMKNCPQTTEGWRGCPDETRGFCSTSIE